LEAERKAKEKAEEECAALTEQVSIQSQELEEMRFTVTRLKERGGGASGGAPAGKSKEGAALKRRNDELEKRLNEKDSKAEAEFREMASLYEQELQRASSLDEELKTLRQKASGGKKTPQDNSSSPGRSAARADATRLQLELNKVTKERDHLQHRLDTEVDNMYRQMQNLNTGIEKQIESVREEAAMERRGKEQAQSQRLDLEIEIEELRMAFTAHHEDFTAKLEAEKSLRQAAESRLDEAGLGSLNAKLPLPPGRPFSRGAGAAMRPITAQSVDDAVEEDEAQVEARIAILEARAKAKMAEIEALQAKAGR